MTVSFGPTMTAPLGSTWWHRDGSMWPRFRHHREERARSGAGPSRAAIPLPTLGVGAVQGVMVEPTQAVLTSRSGKIDATTPAARATIEQLRDVIEAALQTPVRLAGEPPRPLKVSDINVVTQQVAGRVTGLRADLAKLPGGSEIYGVHVQTGDVEAGGEVTGVDLTDLTCVPWICHGRTGST